MMADHFERRTGRDPDVSRVLRALTSGLPVPSGTDPAAFLEKFQTLTGSSSFRRMIPIQECREPLVGVPVETLARFDPHPYVAAGAPYGSWSPFSFRQGVAERLLRAQAELNARHPGFRLKIYDGYRPVAVQEYMVGWTFDLLCREEGLDPTSISDEKRAAVMEKVYSIWALPSRDPSFPPPHSTGAAVDLTIIDSSGSPLPMGSDIDALPPESLPNHFAESVDSAGRTAHRNRLLLKEVMEAAGFLRLAHEWWHFSYGDQFWALLHTLRNPETLTIACYGAVEQ